MDRILFEGSFDLTHRINDSSQLGLPYNASIQYTLTIIYVIHIETHTHTCAHSHAKHLSNSCSVTCARVTLVQISHSLSLSLFHSHTYTCARLTPVKQYARYHRLKQKLIRRNVLLAAKSRQLFFFLFFLVSFFQCTCICTYLPHPFIFHPVRSHPFR